ncbi:MAG: diphosphomevalonate decarboxylase [Myxococcales bacterium]|nr:diphosphomevalonate decarboxylase [Myxococcales bacterium]
MSQPMRAVARANTNIALVKYWGKRDTALNLPAVGSLSLTLDGLSTRTTVVFDGKLAADSLLLNGADADERALGRVSKFLDLVRTRAGLIERARVESVNDFPTAAGLASSASAFAALAVAATHAAGLELSDRELSILARRGSGSAARSIFGGFSQMHRGESADGEDSFAEPIVTDWDVRLVIAATMTGRKATLSTDGMRHTAETSPYYDAWVKMSERDLGTARDAITRRDLQALGEVTEASCLSMHASAMAARPAVLYFVGATIEGYRIIQDLRRSGVPAWFTCDAGPHVKALTDAAHAQQVEAALAKLGKTWICRPGPHAEVLE